MSRWAARVIVALRFVLVPMWVGGAVLAVLYLPTLGQGQGGAIGAQLLPADAPALQAELLSKTQFGVPLISRTVVVRYDRTGLPPGAMAQAVQTARDVRAGRFPDLRGLEAVIPVPRTAMEPGSASTTMLYFLHFRPGTGGGQSVELAHRFAAGYVPAGPGEFVGVTGTEPATVARAAVIKEWVPVITLVTIVLIAVAVGLFFRSPIAPLVALLIVGIAFVVASGVLGWLGQVYGLVVPPEVEPVVVVLIFGVVTDYSIFFLSHFRRHLRESCAARDAARLAASEVIGIVGVAGLVVAVSTGALAFAQLSFFRVFGPALAVAVLVGALVTATFMPCVLALLGYFALWPSVPKPGPALTAEVRRGTAESRTMRAWIARVAVHWPLGTVIACILLLGAAAVGLTRYDVGNPIIRSLPASAGPQRAYDVATTGRAAQGILAPTVAVVRAPGAGLDAGKLRQLKTLLAAAPGVARVYGPGDLPPGVAARAGDVFVTPSGNLARLLVVFQGDPLDAPAVNALRALRDRAPALLRAAGVTGAQLQFAGDTAITADLVDRTAQDLVRVAPVALLGAFLVLALFLRSLLAPLCLVATSVLALLAALGLSAIVFDPLLDPAAVAFFVPFAVSILLLGLGSDYNVFLTGRIWDEVERRPLREAVRAASTGAARSIATAGVVLAGSFALLALVPLTTFRAIAITMVIGLVLDAFLVRQLLVPALLVLIGTRGWRPGRRHGVQSP
ncbi:MAG: MMPL family transporter [Pseudonocardiaceae bacterium]